MNGSDYPLPEMGAQFGAAKLRLGGLLSADDHRLCAAVRAANPLLHDFVVKRSLQFTEGDRVHRFSPVVFESARIFRRRATAEVVG